MKWPDQSKRWTSPDRTENNPRHRTTYGMQVEQGLSFKVRIATWLASGHP